MYFSRILVNAFSRSAAKTHAFGDFNANVSPVTEADAHRSPPEVKPEVGTEKNIWSLSSLGDGIGHAEKFVSSEHREEDSECNPPRSMQIQRAEALHPQERQAVADSSTHLKDLKDSDAQRSQGIQDQGPSSPLTSSPLLELSSPISRDNSPLDDELDSPPTPSPVARSSRLEGKSLRRASTAHHDVFTSTRRLPLLLKSSRTVSDSFNETILRDPDENTNTFSNASLQPHEKKGKQAEIWEDLEEHSGEHNEDISQEGMFSEDCGVPFSPMLLGERKRRAPSSNCSFASPCRRRRRALLMKSTSAKSPMKPLRRGRFQNARASKPIDFSWSGILVREHKRRAPSSDGSFVSHCTPKRIKGSIASPRAKVARRDLFLTAQSKLYHLKIQRERLLQSNVREKKELDSNQPPAQVKKPKILSVSEQQDSDSKASECESEAEFEFEFESESESSDEPSHNQLVKPMLDLTNTTPSRNEIRPHIDFAHTLWVGQVFIGLQRRCLQCVIKDMPCDLQFPSCARCAREGNGAPCLVQRDLSYDERCHIGIDGYPYTALARLKTDTDEIWKQKQKLEDELLEVLQERCDKQNWVLPVNDRKTGGWESLAKWGTRAFEVDGARGKDWEYIENRDELRLPLGVLFDD